MLKIKHLDRALAYEAMLARERQRRLDGGLPSGPTRSAGTSPIVPADCTTSEHAASADMPRTAP